MNPPLPEPDPLEQQLDELKPAAVPGHLRQRLLSSRSQVRLPARNRAPGWDWTRTALRWSWAPLAAAAVVVLLFTLRPSTPTAPAPPPASTEAALPPTELERVFTADQADQFLVRAEPLDVVVAENGTPYQLVRCTWIDRETYRAPDSDERVQLIQARNQIVPVALRLY